MEDRPTGGPLHEIDQSFGQRRQLQYQRLCLACDVLSMQKQIIWDISYAGLSAEL